MHDFLRWSAVIGSSLFNARCQPPSATREPREIGGPINSRCSANRSLLALAASGWFGMACASPLPSRRAPRPCIRRPNRGSCCGSRAERRRPRATTPIAPCSCRRSSTPRPRRRRLGGGFRERVEGRLAAVLEGSPTLSATLRLANAMSNRSPAAVRPRHATHDRLAPTTSKRSGSASASSARARRFAVAAPNRAAAMRRSSRRSCAMPSSPALPNVRLRPFRHPLFQRHRHLLDTHSDMRPFRAGAALQPPQQNTQPVRERPPQLALPLGVQPARQQSRRPRQVLRRPALLQQHHRPRQIPQPRICPLGRPEGPMKKAVSGLQQAERSQAAFASATIAGNVMASIPLPKG